MSSRSPSQTPAEEFRSINILYLAMLAGQVMIAGVLYFVGTGSETVDSNALVKGGIDSMVIIGISIFVAAVSASFVLFNKRKVEGSGLQGSLMDKLRHYRSSFVLRAALLEGPNLMMIVFYFFLKSNIVFLLLFAVGIVLFLMIRPTVDRITQDYQLSGMEQSELRNSTL